MILELTSTDSERADRVINVWKNMVSTTVHDQSKTFDSLKDYVAFRIVDTGAP